MTSCPLVGRATGAALARVPFFLQAVPTSSVDTTRRFHRLKVHSEVFEIDVRYSKLAYIASGAYGFVCSAEDTVRRAACGGPATQH
jgi:hypothetical protein